MIKTISFKTLRKLNYLSSDEMLNKLHFSAINIFIGANGSGKSTVLDIVHLLSDPNKLLTLQRENWPDGKESILNIEFDNSKVLKIKFLPYDPKEDSFDFQKVYFIENHLPIGFSLYKHKHHKNNKNLANISNIINRYNSSEIFYFDSSTEELSCEELATELEEIRPFLSGISNKEEQKVSCLNGKISMYLEDDTVQENDIEISAIPSGWKAISKIYNWLRNVTNNSICIIEEPETHLHPKLQRLLLNKLISVSEKKGIQLFISSHSSVFINISNQINNNISIFRATGDYIENLTTANKNNLLDDLGVKASDIIQSNAIIWVEGPSDRVYIKHWLSLWCNEKQKKIPKENIDYSFVFTCGSSISHFTTAEEETDYINMLMINRNSILVIDNDNDFDFDSNEVMSKTNIRNTSKYRIVDSLNGAVQLWITKNYCIETYIDRTTDIDNFFEYDENGKFLIKSGHSKIDVAKKIVKNQKSFKDIDDLEKKISLIHQKIYEWNNN